MHAHVQAPLCDILRVHEWEYVSELRRVCGAINDSDPKASPTFLDPPGHPKDTVVRPVLQFMHACMDRHTCMCACMYEKMCDSDCAEDTIHNMRKCVNTQ